MENPQQWFSGRTAFHRSDVALSQRVLICIRATTLLEASRDWSGSVYKSPMGADVGVKRASNVIEGGSDRVAESGGTRSGKGRGKRAGEGRRRRTTSQQNEEGYRRDFSKK